jgi:integrase
MDSEIVRKSNCNARSDAPRRGQQDKYTTAVDIICQLALTGCRRSGMIGLKWTEADTGSSYFWLEDSEEGESIRPIGLPVVEYLEHRRSDGVGTYAFPGRDEDKRSAVFPTNGSISLTTHRYRM